MDKEQILETVTELPSDTRAKAWMFQVDTDYYQIASYSMNRVSRLSVWNANKKGKRTGIEIFMTTGTDHKKGIEKFLETLEIKSEVTE